MDLSSWYHVSFDETRIFLNVDAPESKPRQEEIAWRDIIRICYQARNYLMTDELFIFTSRREESYLVPIEADGGFDLWNEIIRRGLFDTELSIKIATATKGRFCWPPGKPAS